MICFLFSGIRYFGLITWPILVCSTILTCFIALLHYDTSTSYTIVLFLFTIHFECLILALVRQLTSIVGGSCVGYALVAPAFEYELLSKISRYSKEVVMRKTGSE